MRLHLLAASAALAIASVGSGAPVLAPPAELGPDVQPFVHLPAGQTAITHLRIVDGTGAAPMEDATLLLDGAKIAGLKAAGAAIPAGYRREVEGQTPVSAAADAAVAIVRRSFVFRRNRADRHQ